MLKIGYLGIVLQMRLITKMLHKMLHCIGYIINLMRQCAYLVVNQITLNNFASVFNCTPVGRASDPQ